jgi:hypothetical protein
MTNILFFAMDCVHGRLIETGFDHEELIIFCKKKGHKKIIIWFINGSSSVFEEVDINVRLGLPGFHRFHWSLRCWLNRGHIIRYIMRQFDKGKTLEYCKCCGRIFKDEPEKEKV